MFLFFPGESVRVYGGKIFYYYVLGYQPGKLGFEDLLCIVHDYRDYRAAGAVGYAEASFVELHKICFVLVLVPCAFGEDEHGDSVFDHFSSGLYYLHALTQVVAVKEKAVAVAHPKVEYRETVHFLLGHEPRHILKPGKGYQNVEIAPVVSDIQYSCVPGDILHAPEFHLRPAYKEYQAKSPLNHPE